MAEKDRFEFEDEGYDFPFYDKNPYVPKWGWIVLLIAFIVGSILTISSHISYLILACIVYTVPLLYFLKWDYKRLFRKLSRRDVALAIALFIGYVIYAIIMEAILKQFGIVSPGTIDPNAVTSISFIEAIFSLFCEEMLKFIPFIIFLRVIYKYTANRKLSLMISVAIIMIMFASMHAYNPTMFIFALFIQGLGPIFEFYGYIKTKNLLVPYLTHLLTDWFVYLMILLGIGL